MNGLSVRASLVALCPYLADAVTLESRSRSAKSSAGVWNDK